MKNLNQPYLFLFINALMMIKTAQNPVNKDSLMSAQQNLGESIISQNSVKFSEIIKTSSTFDMFEFDLLVEVKLAKGSIIIPKSEQFTISQLFIGNFQETKTELDSSGNCNYIQGDPNSYVMIHDPKPLISKNTGLYDEELMEVPFTVTNFYVKGYNENSYIFLRLSTESGKTLYSNPIFTKEINKKDSEIAIIGKKDAIHRFPFSASRAKYTFLGQERHTSHHGLIDTAPDNCGESKTTHQSCDYEFTQYGTKIMYKAYKISTRPQMFIDNQGNRKFYFSSSDKVVVDRLAKAKKLTCQDDQKLPFFACIEGRANFSGSKCDEKYIECLHSDISKAENTYKQLPPTIIKVSNFNMKYLEPKPSIICMDPYYNVIRKIDELESLNKSKNSMNMRNYSLLTFSQKDHSLKNILIENDLYQHRISCKQVDPSISFAKDLWLDCNLPLSHESEFYYMYIKIKNDKWRHAVSCHNKSCDSKVYYFRFNYQRNLWEIRLEGKDLKGSYLIWLEYKSKTPNIMPKHSTQPFKIFVSKLGNNPKIRFYHSLILIIPSIIIVSLVFWMIISLLNHKFKLKEKIYSKISQTESPSVI